MALVRLVLFTRDPVPGTAKTRLIPALGGAGAAKLHSHLTERTVSVLRDAQQQQDGLAIEIHTTGGDAASFESWLGSDLQFVQQSDGDLTARLLGALDPAPVIFFGADTPDLNVDHVQAAILALQSSDVVIGPADDGGYYLIGIAAAYRYLFEDMRWSTEHVTPDTLARAQAHGLRVAMLDTLHDCDRPSDLARWPQLLARLQLEIIA